MTTSIATTLRLVFVAAAGCLCFFLATSPASADSTPVGPLPPGPTSVISAKPGELVAIALLKRAPASGLVWRLARNVDASVLRQVSEDEIGSAVVVLFRVTGRGRATVRFALTRGDASSIAVASRTYRIIAR